MAEFAKPLVTIELEEYNGMKKEIKVLKSYDANEEKQFSIRCYL